MSVKQSPRGKLDWETTFCPKCQLPFRLLKIETPGTHIMKCWKRKIAKSECPDGKNCVSEMAMHYILYSHKELAESRTKTEQSDEKDNVASLHGCSKPSSSVRRTLMETIYLSDGQTSSEEFSKHESQINKMLTQSKNNFSSVKKEQNSPVTQVNEKSSRNTPRKKISINMAADISLNKSISNKTQSTRKIQDTKPSVNIQKEKKNFCSKCLTNKSRKMRNKSSAVKKIKTEIPMSTNPWSIAASQSGKSFHNDKNKTGDVTEDAAVIDLTSDVYDDANDLEEKGNKRKISCTASPKQATSHISSSSFLSKRRKTNSGRSTTSRSMDKDIGRKPVDSGGETLKDKGKVTMEKRNKRDSPTAHNSTLSSSSKRCRTNLTGKFLFLNTSNISTENGNAKNKAGRAEKTFDNSRNVNTRKGGERDKKKLMSITSSKSSLKSLNQKHDPDSSKESEFPFHSTQKENVNVGRIDFDNLETQDSDDSEIQLPKGPGLVLLSPIKWPSSLPSDDDEKPFVVQDKTAGTSQDISIDLCTTSGSGETLETYRGWGLIGSQGAGDAVPGTKGSVGANVSCENAKVQNPFAEAKRSHDTYVDNGIGNSPGKISLSSINVDLLDGDIGEDLSIDDSCLLSEGEETYVADASSSKNVCVNSVQQNITGISKDVNIRKVKDNELKSKGSKNVAQPFISSTEKQKLLKKKHQNVISPAVMHKEKSKTDKNVKQPFVSYVTDSQNAKKSFHGSDSEEEVSKSCKAWVKTRINRENLDDSYDYLLEDSLLAGFPDDMNFPEQPTNSGSNSDDLPRPSADISSNRSSKNHQSKDEDQFSNTKPTISPKRNHPASKLTSINLPQTSFKSNKSNRVTKQKQGDIGVMLLGRKPKPKEPPKKAYTYNYRSSNSGKRCPMYKKIEGTDIAVDAFSYGVIVGIDFYFLSHFHFDHYIGLTKQWKHKVYCSEVFGNSIGGITVVTDGIVVDPGDTITSLRSTIRIILIRNIFYKQVTGNLVKLKIRLPDHLVVKLPMNEEVLVRNVKVTLLEANHCPGAVLFLFKLRNNCVVLHTGDFRAHPSMESYPSLNGCKVSTLHLDTTYLDPNYSFPSQSEVIDAAISIATSAVKQNHKTLFMVGTYTVGKERIFTAMAKAIKSKIFVMQEKYRVLGCMMDKELNEMLTRNPREAQVHVVSMTNLNKMTYVQNYLAKYDCFDRLFAVKPTGWTHSKADLRLSQIKPQIYGNISIYGLPYSEHSSFKDLERFVRFLKPKKIIPTVNISSKESRQKMYRYLNEWKTGS